MKAKMAFDVSNDDFRVESVAQTNGLLKMVLNAQNDFYSEGKIIDNQFVVFIFT